jgi:hypothetical protein
VRTTPGPAHTGVGGRGGGGGAVAVESGAAVQLHGCVVHDNVAGHGGGGELGGGPGGNGGGVYVSGGTCQILNCTLAQNDAGFGEGSSPRGNGGAAIGGSIANSVIWANSPNQLAGSIARYSCVQGGASGAGNISNDPTFVAMAADNFRLAPFSRCIDAGENASVPNDALDLDDDGDTSETLPQDRDGNARIRDDLGVADTGSGDRPLVDMGAYEIEVTSGCPADLDGDGAISLADLARLLSNFGRSDASAADGDLSGDGTVNLTDLTLLLASFGATC